MLSSSICHSAGLKTMQNTSEQKSGTTLQRTLPVRAHPGTWSIVGGIFSSSIFNNFVRTSYGNAVNFWDQNSYLS